MKCPVCNVELRMTDRQGIEIDYCPQCRGVWLDRGELDKLIERAAPAQSTRDPQFHPYQPERDRDRDHGEHERHRHRKRKSFLGDLFDFD